MTALVGLDVGGANTKAARITGSPPTLHTASHVHEIWRASETLEAVIAAVLAQVAPEGATAIALTTTAELADCFRTKREGVAVVLDAVERAARGACVSVITSAGELVPLAAARECPLEVAAANWAATARVVAEAAGTAVVLDVGGTTTDVIPVAGGRIAAQGRTDVERLLAGELVYTGVLRTNAATLAPAVPLRGTWCPVAAELFATAADVHLLTGALRAEQIDAPTADERPATAEFARERLARLVCGDRELLTDDEIDAIAAFLAERQVERVAAALARVGARRPATVPVVALGSGAFLARAAAERAGLTLAAPPAAWGADGEAVAPAAALATLLAHEPPA